MVSISRWLLIPALLIGWLGLTVRASAAVAPVLKDDGKFFSAEAVNKANDKIKKIAQDYNKDLLIETFPEIPGELKKDYSAEKKKEFFARWARDRAHDNAVNGVYVLICKEPSHLQIEVGNETRRKAFTEGNRDEMVKILLGKFRAKKYDEGLQEAVDFYARTLRQNLGRTTGGHFAAQNEWPGHGRKTASLPPANDNRGGNPLMGWLCIGVVVLLGVWLLFGLIRAFTGAGRGGYGGGGYGGGGGGGGGGFLSSLLGGMLGAGAGMWMYDHFFHGGSSGWGGTAQAERRLPAWMSAVKTPITPARAAISATMTAEEQAATLAVMTAEGVATSAAAEISAEGVAISAAAETLAGVISEEAAAISEPISLRRLRWKDGCHDFDPSACPFCDVLDLFGSHGAGREPAHTDPRRRRRADGRRRFAAAAPLVLFSEEAAT